MTSSPKPETTPIDATLSLREELGIPKDTPHLTEALTHPSFTNERPGGRDNQRLEFLGDAVLSLCTSELLMEAFAEVDEGALTIMRASLVNTDALAAAARKLSLADALRLGRGADTAGERHRTNVLADGLEAVLGAVFQDHGLDAARLVSKNIVAEGVAALVASGGIRRDAKSRLQELLQARRLEPPTYRLVAEDGPAHDRTFTAEVDFPELRPGSGQLISAQGQGRSKKLAERAAAAAALKRLEDESAGGGERKPAKL